MYVLKACSHYAHFGCSSNSHPVNVHWRAFTLAIGQANWTDTWWGVYTSCHVLPCLLSTVSPWRQSSCVPTFHCFTMETIKLCLLSSSVRCSCIIAIIGDLKGNDTSWQWDHRTGKGSQSAPWFPRQSNQQPFCWHIQLWQCTSTTHLHVTKLQWKCSAYSLWIITRSSLNGVPIPSWKWIDSMHIRCASKQMAIRCECAKPNSCAFDAHRIRFYVLVWTGL